MKSTEYVMEKLKLTQARYPKDFTAIICIFDNTYCFEKAYQRAMGVERKKIGFDTDFFNNGFMIHARGNAEAIQIVYDDIQKVVAITRAPHFIRQITWEDLVSDEDMPLKRTRRRPHVQKHLHMPKIA